MTPEEFEKKVFEIHKILQGRHASVEWNAHIKDPDNPKQKRQIDVLVKDNESITIIECRHHQKKQDVKWIEEIYGRRISLNGMSAIAVSSSGFTEGAIKKANRLGVIIRNFSELTVKEIESWCHKLDVDLVYVKFDDFEIYFVHQIHLVQSPITPGNKFTTRDGSMWDMNPLFYLVAEKAMELSPQFNSLRLQVFTKDLWVNNIKVEEIIIQTKYKEIIKKQFLPVVETYGTPGREEMNKEVKIQKSPDSMVSFCHATDEVIPVIDLSETKVIPGAVFRNIRFTTKPGMTLKGIQILGYKGPVRNAMPYKYWHITKDNYKYRSLLSSQNSQSIITI